MFKTIHLVLLLLVCASFSLAQTRIIPHVTVTGNGFTTDILLENSSVLNQDIVLTPFSSDGAALTPITMTVPAQSVSQSPTTQVFGGDISHFTIQADDSVKVSAVYDFDGTGAPAHVPETTDQASSFRIHPGDWSQVFDGLAVVNMGSEATDVWIRQRDFAGNIIQTLPLREALAANQKALFVIGAPNGSPFTFNAQSYFEVYGNQMLSVVALRGTLSGSDLGVLWANDASPQSQSTTTRNAKGVWHIKGGSLYDVHEAMGYNVAIDRFWQTDFLRHVNTGHYAEIIGPAGLASDQVIRTINYPPEELDALFKGLDEETRIMIEAYVAGLNRRVAEVLSDNSLLPFEYVALNISPKYYTAKELMLLISNAQRNFSLNAFGSDQILNLDLAANLINFRNGNVMGASLMFEDLRWVDDAQTVTTFPKTDAQLKRAQARAKNSPRPDWSQIDWERIGEWRAAGQAIKEQLQARDDAIAKWGANYKMGSYAWVVNGSKTASGNPILYAGPQVGFNAPVLFLEGSVESEALTVSGMTVPGIPAFVVGRTPTHAWGVEVGHTHSWDYYIEEQTDVFTQRTESIKVAGGPDVPYDIQYGPHGPIINNQAPIAWKYAHWGKYEFDLSKSILNMARAKNIDEFDAAVNRLGISLHIHYADKDDNIGFWMSGRNPVREEGNWRFPQGFLPALEWDREVINPVPHHRNAERGWYGGWNNRISLDVPDPTATHRYGGFHRGHFIMDWLENQSDLTFEQVRDFAFDVAATDNFSGGGNQVPFIEAAGWLDIVRANPTPERLEALDILTSWDGAMPKGNRGDWTTGTETSEAWALARQWAFFTVTNVFDDELGTPLSLEDADWRFQTILHAMDPNSGWTNFYDWFGNNADATKPQTPEANVLAALDQTLEIFGPRPWNLALGPRLTNDFENTPLGLVLSLPFLNKATYAQCVELDSTGPIRIETALSLGQDGNIFLNPQTGFPTTKGGTVLPLNGEIPENDPFFSGRNYDLFFELEPFPLFGEN